MGVKSVLVTGASTGIGEACALRLDRLGHRVYAGVRSEEHAHGLRQRGSDRIVPVFVDVTDQGQIDAAAKQIADDGGRLAGVVNNAGIASPGNRPDCVLWQGPVRSCQANLPDRPAYAITAHGL